MRPISIVVAEDQPLIRAGIVLLLESQPDLTVVAEAANGQEAVDLALARRPDVVLMDLKMPVLDGVAATRQLCADRTEVADELIKVLVLTTFDDDQAVYSALLAGASGYVLKQAVPHDLLAAVRRVAAGEAWIDPAVAGRLLTALRRTPRVGEPVGDLIGRLTGREREVLVLMAEGLSNSEIAERLFVGEGTVKTHVSRVLMKTATRDRAQAIALAYRSGLITL